jgi:hypothetical protein
MDILHTALGAIIVANRRRQSGGSWDWERNYEPVAIIALIAFLGRLFARAWTFVSTARLAGRPANA